MTDIKFEGVAMRKPSHIGGRQLRQQFGTNPHEPRARTAAQPLYGTTDDDIRIEVLQRDWNNTGRLRHVDDARDTEFAATLRYRADRLDRAPVGMHMRDYRGGDAIVQGVAPNGKIARVAGNQTTFKSSGAIQCKADGGETLLVRDQGVSSRPSGKRG